MNKEKALKNQGLEFREDISLIWGVDVFLDKVFRKTTGLTPNEFRRNKTEV